MHGSLTLRFLGVGNAAAHDLGNAAVVLEDPRQRPLLLIDCGPTVLPAYLDCYGELPHALFITHTHLDHVGGLEGLFYRLACHTRQRHLVRLYLPAALVERLQRQLADDPYKLAEGGMNFWDCFQVVPVGDQFWHANLSFDVFTVNHHGYRSAFGIRLREQFVFTGDTRPIPDALETFADAGEPVFHDCGLHENPSHTGLIDLAKNYPPELRERLILYHYESTSAAACLEASGYRVAHPGERFLLGAMLKPKLREVG
jgi:ribonuclease BN (tRNA processing enzyme)